jgi:hypothetical protein
MEQTMILSTGTWRRSKLLTVVAILIDVVETRNGGAKLGPRLPGAKHLLGFERQVVPRRLDTTGNDYTRLQRGFAIGARSKEIRGVEIEMVREGIYELLAPEGSWKMTNTLF